MPAYNVFPVNGVTAAYPGDTVTVWNAEAVLTNGKSMQVALGVGFVGEIEASVELVFNQAPGAFEIDVQEADVDAEANYVNTVNGSVTTVNANNAARLDLTAIKAKFIRLFMKTQPANGGTTVTARITR